MSNILEALAATEPGTAGHRCKVGRWLDSLAGEPNVGELVAAFETVAVRTLPQLCAIAARLGHPISDHTIGMHRSGDCRCAW